jgi:hypothetical protein
MKRTAWLALAIMGLMVLAPVAARADRRDDLQAIKKAVKENPAYEPGKEVRWFKILVTDHRSHKETVRITLPIAVFDLFMKYSDESTSRSTTSTAGTSISARSWPISRRPVRCRSSKSTTTTKRSRSGWNSPRSFLNPGGRGRLPAARPLFLWALLGHNRRTAP